MRLTRSNSSNAVWDRAGTALFYESDGRVYRVPLQSVAALTFGEPELVADNLDFSDYALAADGRSLLAAGDEERALGFSKKFIADSGMLDWFPSETGLPPAAHPPKRKGRDSTSHPFLCL